MAMTPRLRSSSVSCSSVLSAPRSLNEAVNWRFSNFIQTSAWAMRDRVSLRRQGVWTTAPLIRAAAAQSLELRQGDRVDVEGGEKVVLGREVPPVHRREDPYAGFVQHGGAACEATEPCGRDQAEGHVLGDVATVGGCRAGAALAGGMHRLVHL
jgi:hypothetical protein